LKFTFILDSSLVAHQEDIASFFSQLLRSQITTKMQLPSSLPLLSLILALHTTATPTHFRRDGRSPDACGPTQQNPWSPKDTCSAPLAFTASTTARKPSTFSNVCVLNPNLGQYGYNIFTYCPALIPQICNSLSVAAPLRDQWVWADSTDCAMGFWMPGIATSALVPQQPQCVSIFTAMLTQCAPPLQKAQGSSVNLQVLPIIPSIQTGAGYGQNASGTGMAVEPLYPSYVMYSKRTGGT